MNPKSTENVKHLYIYIHIIALEEILLQDIWYCNEKSIQIICNNYSIQQYDSWVLQIKSWYFHIMIAVLV